VIRFVADCHLGKLAKYVRLMGYDTLYFPQIQDDELIRIANEEGRTILTRDRQLCGRDEAPCFLFDSMELTTQLRAMIVAFELDVHGRAFARCIVCNTPLKPVSKEEVLERLPPKVQLYFDEFEWCKTCERVYWHGDHYQKMCSFLDAL